MTLMGNLPLMTRFIGRGVSVPSLDSSPPDSVSERSDIAFCLKNLLICDVTAMSSISLSWNPPLGGVVACGCSTSLGGNRTGFPSSLRTCKDAISARQRGKASIRFFWTERTFSEVNFANSGGNILSLFRPRSRISRDVNWHI